MATMRLSLSHGGIDVPKVLVRTIQAVTVSPIAPGRRYSKIQALRPRRRQSSYLTRTRGLQTSTSIATRLPDNDTSEITPETKSAATLSPRTNSCRKPELKDGFVAYIALGSNMGDTLANIEAACNLMDADPGIRIERTSALYETQPMYVEDQNRFLNGACEIRTSYKPLELLDRLQAIEKELKREKIVEKGPRTIDLDILMYNNTAMRDERLTIPHPLMHEREFVLRPLVDIRSAQERSISGDVKDKENIVSRQLAKTTSSSTPMYPQVHLAPDMPALHYRNPAAQTLVMSILNTTPDSFSDGGDNKPADVEALKQTVQSHVASGAKIIDIGGQSSRPNAPDISADEEISRIHPAIEAIKSCPGAGNVAISVDTYRAPVAKAAIEAGAHIVNDISSGTLDPDMFSTVAKLGCTYIMMHMRGDPSNMQSEYHCSYPNGLLRSIASELRERIGLAEDAGIRRWRMILDPGIGFSKTHVQNLELLKGMPELRRMLKNFPWLVGSSRKGFIGATTGVKEPKDRIWGTAATVAAAVQGGANVVRVHDVAEMATVVKMADAIYRR